MANLFSRHSRLTSLFEAPAPDDAPPEGDTRPVALGEPLVVRYLSFYLRDRATGRQHLMISTFVKAEERKSGAAEAINYFNPEARFSAQRDFRLTDFGGQHYGHPLCYYTKSYLGESIRLTTKIMELDKVDRRVMAALRGGVGVIAGLPISASYLAYSALANAGFSVAERLINLLNRDDTIVDSHSLDLHFERANTRRLQAGRIVCVPGADDDALLRERARWRLSTDNRLVDAASGAEYDRGSYFVLDVRAEANPAYDKFDYFQNVAELLERTNRGGNPAEFIEYGLDLVKGHQDFRLIEQIESLAVTAHEEDSRRRITATFRLLSPMMQRIYETRARQLLTA